MSTLLKWRQSWVTEAAQFLDYEESWTEAFALETDDLATTGHAGITGDIGLGLTFDIGSGTMDTVGHMLPTVQGISYPTEFVPSFGGTMPMGGRATIAGELDFEEPFFVDPPLQVYPTGRMAMTATFVPLITKSIGSGALTVAGRGGFNTVSFGYQTAIVKQLFSLSLPATGRTTVSGVVSSTSVKDIGSGSMWMGGRPTVDQSGFSIEAPEPYTHPVGPGVMLLVGNVTTTGDPVWRDWPAHDMGSGDMAMAGHQGLSVSVLFAGGTLPLVPSTFGMAGRTGISSRFSYPGSDSDYPDTEIVAVYEGLDMQQVFADYEGDEVVAT